MDQTVRKSLKLNRGMARLSLTPVLFIALLGGVHQSDAHQLRGEPSGSLLHNSVVQRSLNELSIAKSANRQARSAAKAAETQRESYASHVTVTRAMENFDKVKGMVPEAKAAVLEMRRYAMQARQHADHAVEVEKASRRIPEMAAERSKEAIEGWIKSDAAKVAEASAMSPKDFSKQKAEKMADRVAAAAEPYHLALLRNQKFAAETYSKAKTAQQSSQDLHVKATKMAQTAQEMQAAGLAVDAQEMMTTAHGLRNEAATMQQWSLKLYNQANAAGKSAGGYTLSEQEAATNAATSTILNAPMKLPPSSS